MVGRGWEVGEYWGPHQRSRGLFLASENVVVWVQGQPHPPVNVPKPLNHRVQWVNHSACELRLNKAVTGIRTNPGSFSLHLVGVTITNGCGVCEACLECLTNRYFSCIIHVT